MVVENDLRLQLYALAPAPCRDYYGLTITGTQVILNIWNISHGPHIYPKRQKASLEDFGEATSIQNEIKSLFGEHVLNFCKALANNESGLQNLPTKIFLRILKLLASRDILSLSQTSKIFFELCNGEPIWKMIFRKKIRRPIARDDSKMADELGWKGLLKKKLTMRKKILKTTAEIRPRNNAKVVAPKQNNIDVIRNVKRQDFPKNLANAISVTELSIRNNVGRSSAGRNVVVQNNKTNYPAVRNSHSANMKNVNITGISIRDHLNGSSSGVNLRQKTVKKIAVQK